MSYPYRHGCEYRVIHIILADIILCYRKNTQERGRTQNVSGVDIIYLDSLIELSV